MADQRAGETPYVAPVYQFQPYQRPPETWTLTLNRYQRDNLLWLLNACGYPHPHGVEPFTLANTGDWLGEIVQKLGKIAHPGSLDVHAAYVVDVDDRPNCSLDELALRVAMWQARSVATEPNEHDGADQPRADVSRDEHDGHTEYLGPDGTLGLPPTTRSRESE